MTNRIIKFRVWDVLNQKLHPWRIDVDFYLSQDGTTGNGFVLQQFTGLMDKNNKEIFEGDIVTFVCAEGEGVSAVKFMGATFCVFPMDDKDEEKFPVSMTDEQWEFGKYEVIGNTFENPELLVTK